MYWDSLHNRLTSQAGPEYFKTYTWTAPLSTHWRRGTCEEVDCADFRLGFVMTVDFSNELGRRQLYYLTKEDKDRHHILQRTGPYEVKLIYPPGNQCMKRASHRVPLEREPYYLVCGGDWRGNPRQVRTVKHVRAEDWIDDFGIHQDQIADQIQKG